MKCLPALILIAALLVAAEGKALPAGENQQVATQTFELPSHLQEEVKRVLNNFTNELVKEISSWNLEEPPNNEGKPVWGRDFRTLVRNIINEMRASHPGTNNFRINLRTEMTITMDNTNVISQTSK